MMSDGLMTCWVALPGFELPPQKLHSHLAYKPPGIWTSMQMALVHVCLDAHEQSHLALVLLTI